jgi:hypothetical protein
VHPNVKALNWHRHSSTCTSRANSAIAACKRPTGGCDRGVHQLPKRSRNFSDARTLNLV